jgi:hypothetical protein
MNKPPKIHLPAAEATPQHYSRRPQNTLQPLFATVPFRGRKSKRLTRRFNLNRLRGFSSLSEADICFLPLKGGRIRGTPSRSRDGDPEVGVAGRLDNFEVGK